MDLTLDLDGDSSLSHTIGVTTSPPPIDLLKKRLSKEHLQRLERLPPIDIVSHTDDLPTNIEVLGNKIQLGKHEEGPSGRPLWAYMAKIAARTREPPGLPEILAFYESSSSNQLFTHISMKKVARLPSLRAEIAGGMTVTGTNTNRQRLTAWLKYKFIEAGAVFTEPLSLEHFTKGYIEYLNGACGYFGRQDNSNEEEHGNSEKASTRMGDDSNGSEDSAAEDEDSAAYDEDSAVEDDETAAEDEHTATEDALLLSDDTTAMSASKISLLERSQQLTLTG
jgi:hypothetical protein